LSIGSLTSSNNKSHYNREARNRKPLFQNFSNFFHERRDAIFVGRFRVLLLPRPASYGRRRPQNAKPPLRPFRRPNDRLGKLGLHQTPEFAETPSPRFLPSDARTTALENSVSDKRPSLPKRRAPASLLRRPNDRFRKLGLQQTPAFAETPSVRCAHPTPERPPWKTRSPSNARVCRNAEPSLPPFRRLNDRFRKLGLRQTPEFTETPSSRFAPPTPERPPWKTRSPTNARVRRNVERPPRLFRRPSGNSRILADLEPPRFADRRPRRQETKKNSARKNGVFHLKRPN